MSRRRHEHQPEVVLPRLFINMLVRGDIQALAAAPHAALLSPPWSIRIHYYGCSSHLCLFSSFFSELQVICVIILFFSSLLVYIYGYAYNTVYMLREFSSREHMMMRAAWELFLCHIYTLGKPSSSFLSLTFFSERMRPPSSCLIFLHTERELFPFLEREKRTYMPCYMLLRRAHMLSGWRRHTY